MSDPLEDFWVYETIERQYEEMYYQLWLESLMAVDLKYWLIEQGMGL